MENFAVEQWFGGCVYGAYATGMCLRES